MSSSNRVRALTHDPATLDALPVPTWIADPHGNLTFVNRAFREYCGADQGAFAGWAFVDLLHPDDQERITQLWRWTVEQNVPFHAEFRLRSATGSYRIFAGQGAPYLNHLGRIQGWIGSTVDVHERREVERFNSHLQDASIALGSALTHGQVHQVLLEHAQRATGAYMVGLILLDPDGHTLTLSANCGYPEELQARFAHFPVALDVPPSTAVRDRRGIFLQEAELRTRYAATLSTRSPYTCAVAALPLVVGERVLGSLALSFENDRTFEAAARTFLLSLAALGAQALDRARAYEAERDAKLALQQDTAFLRGLLASSPDCVKVLSLDGSLLSMNEGGQRLMEIADFGACQGARWTTFWAGEERPKLEHALEEARAGRTGHFSGYCPTLLGTPKWWDVLVTPLWSPGGEVAQLLAVSRDITALHRAQQELEAREARFRLLAEHATDLISCHAPDGTYLYASPSFERLLGHQPGELLGKAAYDFFHPDDQPAIERGHQHLLRLGTPYSVTYRLRRQDGSYVWVETNSVAVRDVHGQVLELQCATRDVTQRVEARRNLTRHNVQLEQQVRERTAELTRQQRFLSAVLESLSEGIVACDADGTVTLLNGATHRLYGLPAGPVSPEQWAEQRPVYRADGVTPLPTEELPLHRALNGEQVRDAELVIKATGSEPRFVLADGNPIFSPQGERLGAVVAMRDITERQRTTAQLQRSNTELERFAYITSHDLQEPIRTMSSFAGLLERKYGETLDAKGQQYLRYIQRGAQQMKTLVDDVLAFSRLGDAPPALRSVELEAPLTETLSRLHGLLQQTSATLTHDDLPAVLGDGPQLAQLLQNLIGNALKFRRDGVTPELHLGVTREGDRWHFTLRDNGIGMEAAYLEHIFGMFRRLHTRNQYEGTGLGLALCQKIVLWHGGHIWAESEPGVGSTFHFTLSAVEGEL